MIRYAINTSSRPTISLDSRIPAKFRKSTKRPLYGLGGVHFLPEKGDQVAPCAPTPCGLVQEGCSPTGEIYC